MSSNALALIEIKNPHEVFVEKGLDPIINKIRDEVKSVVVDLSTQSGRKECASLAMKVAKSKVALDDMGKSLTEGLKKQTGAVDAERKRMRDALDKLRDEVRQPLTEWEEKEERRIAGHEAAIGEIERSQHLTMFPIPSETVAARLEHVAKLRDRDWEEFAERATATADLASADLNQKLLVAKEQEAQKAELDRLRQAEADRLQKEHDDRLKQEAADKAKAEEDAKISAEAERARQAEADRAAAEEKAKADAAAEIAAAEDRARQAEADRIASEEKAKQDAIEAMAQAQRDADAAVQRERDRVDAEKRAEEQAAAAREANKQHKAKINNEALAAIMLAIRSHNDPDPEIIGKAIVEAIALGAVPHVKITY